MTDAAAGRPRLTFFFPAFNEEENVDETVRARPGRDRPAGGWLDRGPHRRRRLTDRTPELADALAAADPRVRVHHQPNRGYGGALRAGLRERLGRAHRLQRRRPPVRPGARCRACSIASNDPAQARVDAVIGYRIKRRDPPHRIFIAKTYNAIVSVLFGLRVRDIDCAMKLFRREVFDGLPLDTDSPFLSAELLIKLKARGERFAQVGVNHYPRAAGTNTGASFRKILRTFRDIGKLRWALWFRRREVLGTRR